VEGGEQNNITYKTTNNNNTVLVVNGTYLLSHPLLHQEEEEKMLKLRTPPHFFFCVRLSHAMCSSHFLSHNQCLLARALASEYFDRQRFASDKRELHLREVLHTLFCPFGPDPVFRLSHPLAPLPTTHYHDQCICLHPASRGSSHRHGHSPSSFEVQVLLAKPFMVFESRGVSTLRPASEHRLLLVFNAVSYGCNCNAYTFHEDDSVKRP